jgi:hypothetical protein
MPLQINPTLNIVSEGSTVINIAEGNGGRIAGGSGPGFAELEAQIQDQSGGPGSNLNYIAGSNPSNSQNGGSSGVDTVVSTGSSGSNSAGSSGAGSSGGGGGDGLGDALAILGGIQAGIGLYQNIRNISGAIKQAVSGIKAAAGKVDDILSRVRAKNLPAGGDAEEEVSSATPARAVAYDEGADWRLRITADFKSFGSTVFDPLDKTRGVTWPYIPRVTIGYKANYTAIEPIHNNFPFQAYKNSSVDDIQISGEFSVQTQDDGKYWIAVTHFLKTATKMYFGLGNRELVGAPPIICRLSGYGSYIFDDVPVVIKSFQIELPEDVNYINVEINGRNQWVPALSTVSVVVAPVYNRAKLRKFSLAEFAQGAALSRGIL